jgi:tripartite-type tricarboxylate transporter receptor subunit TctC
LVAYARGQNDRLAYAATGVGSITHLATALFLKRAGIDMTPVMYKGGAPAVTDVVAGHVKVYFANMSAVVPFAPGGALRLLAVSSERRLPQFEGVPTMIEAGYPGFKMLNWTGLVAPAGTPGKIIDLVAREVSRAAANPKAAALLAASGASPLGNSPEEFGAMIAADIPLWAEAVKVAGLHKN